MKNKLTYIVALALVASQMIGSASAQTPINNNAVKKIDYSRMGNNNTCSLSHSTRAERKYLAEYTYNEGLRASYTQSSPAAVTNEAVDAGGAYMLITFLNQHKPVTHQGVTLNPGNPAPVQNQTGSGNVAIATLRF